MASQTKRTCRRESPTDLLRHADSSSSAIIRLPARPAGVRGSPWPPRRWPRWGSRPQLQRAARDQARDDRHPRRDLRPLGPGTRPSCTMERTHCLYPDVPRRRRARLAGFHSARSWVTTSRPCPPATAGPGVPALHPIPQVRQRQRTLSKQGAITLLTAAGPCPRRVGTARVPTWAAERPNPAVPRRVRTALNAVQTCRPAPHCPRRRDSLSTSHAIPPGQCELLSQTLQFRRSDFQCLQRCIEITYDFVGNYAHDAWVI